MKRCRHSGLSWRDIDQHGTSYGQAISRWCFECGDYVPWGKSNDAPEAVKIEIRAAELAAGYTLGRGTMDGATIDEDIGWLESWKESWKPTTPSVDMLASHLAGYLAHCIYTHEETVSHE